jgi:hypothetical protein
VLIVQASIRVTGGIDTYNGLSFCERSGHDFDTEDSVDRDPNRTGATTRRLRIHAPTRMQVWDQ